MTEFEEYTKMVQRALHKKDVARMFDVPPELLNKAATTDQTGQPIEPARKQIVLELDARGRISLGSIAQHKLYLVRRDTDGTIVLVPAAVVPMSTLNTIKEGVDVPACGVRDDDHGICNEPYNHPGAIHTEMRDGQIWAQWRSVTYEDELTGSAERTAYVTGQQGRP